MKYRNLENFRVEKFCNKNFRVSLFSEVLNYAKFVLLLFVFTLLNPHHDPDSK